MNRPVRMRSVASIAVAALILLAAAPFSPAAEQVEDILRPQKRNWISLEPPTAAIELQAYYTQDKDSSPSGSALTTETFFRESFIMATRGAVYHPNLVEFSLAGSLALNQQDFRSRGDLAAFVGDSRGNTFDYTLDASATILKNSKAPVYVYAQRFETLDNRDFGPSLRNINNNYGANVNIQSQTLPTRIDVSHKEFQEIDPTHLQGYRQTQDQVQAHTQWRPTTQQSLAADYSYAAVQEHADQSKPLSFQTQTLSLSHTLTFGLADQYGLNSFFDYSNQTGDLPEDRLHWNESLTMEHSKTFETFYRFDYSRETRPGVEESQQRAEAGFRHRLFKSLVTTGTVGYDRFDLSGGDLSSEWYARLNFDYNKVVPFGLLNANLDLDFSERDTKAQDTPVPVFGEAHVFTDPSPIIIAKTNVEANTIVIRDSSRIRVYSPLTDYTVIQYPTRVEIHRTLGGAITDNQPILIDYVLAPQPGSTATTTGAAFGLDYSIDEGWLKGLELYGRYSVQDQQISSAVPSAFIPDDLNDITFGARYRFWHVTLSAEREMHRSHLIPYDATRFGLRYNDRIANGLSLDLNANYDVIDYSDTANNMKFLLLNAGLRYDLSQDFSMALTAGYRDQQDQIYGNMRGMEEQFEIRWRRRKFSISGIIRNVNENVGSGFGGGGSSRRSYQYFQIVLRREF